MLTGTPSSSHRSHNGSHAGSHRPGRSWPGGRLGSRIPPEGCEGGGGPPHLGQRIVDVVGEDLGHAGPAARHQRAEVGQPAIVGLDPGPPALVVGRRRREGQQAPLLEERGHGVREQHLGGDAVGVVLGQASVGVPAAVGGSRLQVGVRVDVGGGPGVELVVPTARQVGPVVEDVAAGVGVCADDRIPAVRRELGGHGVPLESGRWSWRWRQASPLRAEGGSRPWAMASALACSNAPARSRSCMITNFPSLTP